MKQHVIIVFACTLLLANCASVKESFKKLGRSPRYGYIDKTGKMVIEPEFEEARHFSEGLARVKVNGKWGYINESGKIVIKPQFENAREFSEGLARIRLNKKWGYIDKSGKLVIEPQFIKAREFRNRHSPVKVYTQ